MANTDTILAVGRFHGYTDVDGPMKMSVPISTINPKSYIPGRVFLGLKEKAWRTEGLVVGRMYEIVINRRDRTAVLS